MGLTTKGRIPQFQGNLRAVVPTPTFSGRLTDNPADSINPNTGSGPGTGGSGVTFAEIAGTGSTDPFFDDVELLVNGEGSVADSSGNPAAFTVTSNIALDTVTFQEGLSSLRFSENGIAEIADDGRFQVGTDSYTIEAWVYPRSNPPASGSNRAQVIFQKEHSANIGTVFWGLQLRNGPGAPLCFAYFGPSGSTSVALSSGSTLALNTWHHVAAVRDGNNYTLYINGVQAATDTSAHVNAAQNTPASIGGRAAQHGATRFFANANIDAVRFTNGVRYNGNFTPPTEFPTS